MYSLYICLFKLLHAQILIDFFWYMVHVCCAVINIFVVVHSPFFIRMNLNRTWRLYKFCTFLRIHFCKNFHVIPFIQQILKCQEGQSFDGTQMETKKNKKSLILIQTHFQINKPSFCLGSCNQIHTTTRLKLKVFFLKKIGSEKKLGLNQVNFN